MKRVSQIPKGISIAAATFLTVVAAVSPGLSRSQGEGKTLRQVLSSDQMPVDAPSLQNLGKVITSGAELNTQNEFVIAYYISDGTETLNPPIYIDAYDRETQKWKSGTIESADAKREGADNECFGSVLSISALPAGYALETHINPSAGCELILSRELEFKTSLYGWIVGHFGDGGILYHRSQVHFATVHPAEIALYDAATGKDQTIFPRKPFQAVRLEISKQLQEFFQAHADYCRKADDPCDPESFDSELKGEVVTDDREHAVAFEISYELQGYGQDENKPGGPADVVYIYRHVNDGAKMEYREMLWSEIKARAGDVPLQKLVEPEILAKIFAAGAAESGAQHAMRLKSASARGINIRSKER